jgi:hypothetical protein
MTPQPDRRGSLPSEFLNQTPGPSWFAGTGYSPSEAIPDSKLVPRCHSFREVTPCQLSSFSVARLTLRRPVLRHPATPPDATSVSRSNSGRFPSSGPLTSVWERLKASGDLEPDPLPVEESRYRLSGPGTVKGSQFEDKLSSSGHRWSVTSANRGCESVDRFRLRSGSRGLFQQGPR